MNKQEIESILKKYNHEHLLNFYEELSKKDQEELLKEIQTIPWNELEIIKNNTKKHTNDAINLKIEPLDVFEKEKFNEDEFNEIKLKGSNLIKNRQVAVCTMAGGQGSRLGHKGPKGTFIVPIKNPKSIFQIATEHLINIYTKYNVYLDWYIMTSEENNDETKAFFEKNNFLGYKKEYIHFFKQGQFPLTDCDGNIVLKSKGHLFKAANGNGGIFRALEDNGIIQNLKENNIKYLVTCNIDNILVNPVDEVMLGLLEKQNSELGIKSIIKRSPDEPVGVCCLKNNKPSVVEYIDLPKELSEKRNIDGSLMYGEVHIGCNYLSISLLQKISEEKLPWHIAKKKNSYYNYQNKFVEANEINSFKYEMFIFDAFEKAQKAIVYRVKREEEFAPVKNKEGNDSPLTASKMYEKYWNL